jgi:Methylamine utilisation protein MauE
MAFTLDPVYGYSASYTLGAIFLAGALDKLKARELFVSIVQAYGLLPIPLVAVFALAVGIAELVIGCLLFFPASWPFAQYWGIALLVLVTAAVVINLLRGRTELSCGCGGASADQTLSWALVARNVALGSLLSIATLPSTARAMTMLDYFTIVVAVVLGFGLYAAANQLLANAPRLASLSYQ